MTDAVLSKTAADKSRADSRHWGVMLLLSVGVLIAYADRSSISAALANKDFVHHFRMTSVGRGWVGAAFFWSYALAQLPMGWLVDLYGAMIPYAVCFAVWCAATAATGAMPALAGIVIMRTLVGAAEGIVMPASYRWIRHNMPERHTGTALGIFSFGNKVGTAIGAPLGAWLITAYDWRLMFVLTGACGLLWLVPWMARVQNDFPRKDQRAEARRQARSVPFGRIITSPVVWGGIIVNFCYSYFVFFCMTWMPSYLVEQRGLSLTNSGLYTFFSFAGIAIVALAAGWVADRIIDKGGDPVVTRKVFIVAGFIGATTVLFGAYAHSLGAALFFGP